jgi:site-specific DNA recombinase
MSLGVKIKEDKRVGIWIRVSTEMQVEGDSPQHHEARARLYAESKGWQVLEVYRLEAVSGKSVMGHSETQRMLQDVTSGHITGLIFSKLARLARNTRELLEFSDIFQAHHADLISLQESIDTSTPAGRLLYGLSSLLAEWERNEIASRVQASVGIRAKLGKKLGGQPIYGYKFEKDTLVPDDSEAPVRRLMYELFLEHRRVKTVARLLNEAGHRTRKGGRFTDTTVDRLLRDPTAKGVRRANYTKSRGDKKSWDLKPESEWVHLNVEPIVSEEMWEACNHILTTRKKKGTQPSRKTAHLFAGYVYCAMCHKKMYCPYKTPKYVCFISNCRNKIPTEDLEAVFHQRLKEYVFSTEEILSHLDKADQIIQEKKQLLSSLEQQQEKLQADMAKLLQLYMDDQISSQGFGVQYKPLEARSQELAEQIPMLQGEIDFLTIQHLSSDQTLSETQDLYTRWPELAFEEKRQIVERIVKRIEIGKEEIFIELGYDPIPLKEPTTCAHIHKDSLPLST